MTENHIQNQNDQQNGIELHRSMNFRRVYISVQRQKQTPEYNHFLTILETLKVIKEADNIFVCIDLLTTNCSPSYIQIESRPIVLEESIRIFLEW